MNTQFHVPSFGDEVFDLDDTENSTRTTSTTINSASYCNSSMSAGNVVTNNNGTTASYMYQQQTTPQQQQQTAQTKRMINLHNTSDEYHTANEDSFTTNTNSLTVGGSSSSSSSSLQGSGQQGVLAAATTPTPTLAARKQMSPADPNEPAKPLSAYALFFRDTVSAIKQQNPTCSFQELSKIVASMWDALDPVHKSVYNKKNELARNEYIKQMRIYRQQLEEKQATQNSLEEQPTTVSNNTPIATDKSAVFTMNINEQQVPTSTPLPANSQHNVNNTTSALPAANGPAGGEQVQLLNESGNFQKCTRDGCPKRAIINPDWEDEYCSNDCVVIHCRNVFNDWVKSNLEAKQQQQQPQQHQSELQQAQATT